MTTSDSPDRATAPSADTGADAARANATREAAAWFVLLSEEPGDAVLKAKVEDWCNRSDLNREVWERTRRAYRMYGETTPRHPEHWQTHAARKAVPPVRRRPRQARPRSRRARFVGATALALAACVAFLDAPSMLLRLQADVATSTAEVRILDLEDGSRVHLAPQSAIDVRYSNGERRTTLLKGEAFFEVTPNASRPFRVVAGDVTTTVLGTAFDVRREDNGASVAVRHGRVRVDNERASPPVSEELTAGAWARVDAGGTARGTIASEEVATWTDGRLIARGQTIGEIVDGLRRYHRGLIVVQSGAFTAQRVSGVFDLRDPAVTLRDLASAHAAVVREISPWLLLVTAR